jgi:FkbM family methyltransferase
VRDVCEYDRYRLREMTTVPETVLDIGAHIGCFSVLAAHRWPNARIVACEPDPANYFLLNQHLQACTRAGRVTTIKKVVTSDDRAEADFWVVVDKAHKNSGAGSCCRQEPGSAKTRLPAIAIVELCYDQGLTSCDLLKIDCEGAEYSILRALGEKRFLAKIGRITGEWHCGFAEVQRPEDAEAQLHAILGRTHRLAVEVKPSSQEGHFLALRI